MKTVKEIIEELSKFPPDAIVTVYEGEVAGIVILNKGRELGFIECRLFSYECEDEIDDNSPKTFADLAIDTADMKRDIEKGDLK